MSSLYHRAMNTSIKSSLVESEAHAMRTRTMFTHRILQHERDLTRYARYLCNGDQERAQDFVQETLVRAYQAYRSGRYCEEGSARAWLLRIVTNLYNNDYQRRRRWEAKIGLDFNSVTSRTLTATEQASGMETPITALMATTLDEEVELALASLPKKMRMCMILVDMEGLNYAQAAQSLGVPIGTVRSRLSRSRRLLKPLLREYAEARYRITACK